MRDEENLDYDTDDDSYAPRKKKENLISRFINREHPTGVSKDEDPILKNPNVGGFFKLLKRNLGRLFSLNLYIIFGNFPIFFFLLAMSGYVSNHTTAPNFQAETLLSGVTNIVKTPASLSLSSLFSLQSEVTLPSVLTYILFGLSLLLVVTFGLVNIGVVYIQRNIIKESPIFMWSDFIYIIRRNIKQGLVYGIMDALLLVLMAYDIVFFNINLDGSTFKLILFFLALCITLLYLFMRPYIYLMLITFDLSIKKMFKNAVYFTALGIKRNLVALVGTIVVLAVNYFFFAVYIPIGIILPFIIVPSLMWFIGVYAAYPKIKEIMIDPYYNEDGTPKSDPTSSEA